MAGPSDDEKLAAMIAGLDPDDVADLLVRAALEHDDVARAVRLAAADDGDRLQVLRQAVDGSLRTRRFLDYWASSRWAADAAPVVDALRQEAERQQSKELVALIERGIGHLVKVLLTADDSNGEIGSLAHELLRLHAEVCDAGVADPAALAKWMVRFTFEDQDFFSVDPVRYRDRARRRRTRHLPPRGGQARRQGGRRGASASAVRRRLRDAAAGDPRPGRRHARGRCSARTCPTPTSSSGWPRRCSSSTILTPPSSGRAAGSWRRPVGRSPSSTTSPPASSPTVPMPRVCSSCGCTSTSGCRRRRRTGSCARPPSSSDGGTPNVRPPVPCSSNVLRPGSSTHSSTTATRRRPGRPPTATPNGTSTRGSGSASLRLEGRPPGRRPRRVPATRRRRAGRRQQERLPHRRQAPQGCPTAATAAGVAADFDARMAMLREQHRRRPTLIAMLDKAKLP